MVTQNLIQAVKDFVKETKNQDLTDEEAIQFIKEALADPSSSYHDELQAKLKYRETQSNSSDRAMLSS